jgi:DNA phosphorothioation-associated putative methyltransferase
MALIVKYGTEIFEEARKKRIEDLTVYFALGHFGRRKPRTQMPIGLVRDVKAFFDSQEGAYEYGKKALFQVGSNEVIARACNSAYEKLNHGELLEGHSYIFYKDRLGDMPQELRIFVGCAAQLYGDISGIHLIKAHMTSGKVSLMRYDEWSQSQTYLVERIKVDLRFQEVTYFKYGQEYPPPLLENKQQFLI